MTWREQAVCATLPTEQQDWFFADAEEQASLTQHRQAQVFCFGCPVQVECLDYAVRTQPPMGVWGGLTQAQRKRYLLPALRRGGLNPFVLHEVIVKVGELHDHVPVQSRDSLRQSHQTQFTSLHRS